MEIPKLSKDIAKRIKQTKRHANAGTVRCITEGWRTRCFATARRRQVGWRISVMNWTKWSNHCRYPLKPGLTRAQLPPLTSRAFSSDNNGGGGSSRSNSRSSGKTGGPQIVGMTNLPAHGRAGICRKFYRRVFLIKLCNMSLHGETRSS